MISRSLLARRVSGFTLIELLITIAIAGGLLAASIISLQSYFPKQRLLTSVDVMEKALSTAQFEATSRVFWTCLSHDETNNVVSVFLDQNSNRTCGDDLNTPGGDFLLKDFPLRDTIVFPESCGNPFKTIDSGDSTIITFNSIWFNTAGLPHACQGTNCVVTNMEFVLSTPKLSEGTRAREVEVATSGLIEVVDRGTKGYIQTTYAKTNAGDTGTGDGMCE